MRGSPRSHVRLQLLLPRPWLVFGTDVFGEALPPSDPNAMITFGPAGEVWGGGTPATGAGPVPGGRRDGRGRVGLVLDEAFLLGADGQAELAAVLTGLDVV